MASGDESDYEVNFHSVDIDKGPSQDDSTGKSSVVDDVTGQVSKNVTAYMFQAGKEKAKSVLNVYGNIDVLRPYFDVEPREVRQRLISSLIPQKPSADVRQRVPRELYGPLMVVFSLIALLLFQMKLADHAVQEGTLMGAAFGVCFGYWFGVSSMMWVLAYVCNTHITILQLMSLIGYSLFGHCLVIFIGTIFHTSHDHAMFYLLWAIFGGLSSLKMVSVLVSRTAGKSQKLVICGTLATLHLLFLLYLHFAYHQTVEDLSTVLDQPVMPEAVNPAENLNQACNHPAITEVACENKGTVRLFCEEGNIEVLSANYGRTVPDSVLCPYDGKSHSNRTDCVSLASQTKVIEVCGGRRDCYVPAQNSFFGDPCVANYKYLTVTYRCTCADVVKRDLHDMTYKLEQKVTRPSSQLLVDGLDSLRHSAGEKLESAGGKLSNSVKQVVRNANYDVAGNVTKIVKAGPSKLLEAIVPGNKTDIKQDLVQGSLQKAVNGTKII